MHVDSQYRLVGLERLLDLAPHPLLSALAVSALHRLLMLDRVTVVLAAFAPRQPLAPDRVIVVLEAFVLHQP